MGQFLRINPITQSYGAVSAYKDLYDDIPCSIDTKVSRLKIYHRGI